MVSEKKDVVVANSNKVDRVRDFINVYNIRDHTFLIGLKDFVPEDIWWRKDHPRVPSLICFQEDHACECPHGCIPKMAGRCVWLFKRFNKLKQVLVLFKREEGRFRRPKYVPSSLDGNIDYDRLNVPKEDVPRIWVLRVPSNFYELPVPYKMFRANFNGLQVVLNRSKETVVNVDYNFWSGSV